VDDTLVPTLALTLLTIVSAVSLGRLFADTSFLGPVLITALVCHGLAWILRVRGVTPAVATAASIGATVLLVSWIVLPHTTTYGFPGGATLDAFRNELSRASEEFRRVVAPAPTILGFRVGAVLGTAIAAFLADWAAFRMRSLFEAAIPSFTLFLFSAILGASRWHGLSVAAYLAALLLFLAVQHARLQGTSTSWFASRSRGGMVSLLQVGSALGCLVVAGRDLQVIDERRRAEELLEGQRPSVDGAVAARRQLTGEGHDARGEVAGHGGVALEIGEGEPRSTGPLQLVAVGVGDVGLDPVVEAVGGVLGTDEAGRVGVVARPLGPVDARRFERGRQPDRGQGTDDVVLVGPLGGHAGRVAVGQRAAGRTVGAVRRPDVAVELVE
jgi:hypothetical protein